MNPSEKEILDHIKYCYKEYLDKNLTPTECITMIWTYGRTFTKILNCALVTDSVYTYDLKEKNFHFYVKTLMDKKLDYKKVIGKSIKFSILLSQLIQNKGTAFNQEKRVTYRGVHKTVLLNVKENDIFRLTNWI